MASACGIHIDQRRFHLVVLDGGTKKHKVTAHASGEVPPGADPVAYVAQALRSFAKKHRVKADNVELAVDSGRAAFRSITLPFDDPAKIEEVLKFEIEGDLPQWDIEDVVVDFHVVASKPGVESKLLVTALPKDHLAMQLGACEAAGLEALEASLDGTAVFNAARAAGALDPDEASVLVHVGDATTVVLVADGDRLVSMRAIRAGAAPRVAAEAAPELDEFDELAATDEPRVDEPLGDEPLGDEPRESDEEGWDLDDDAPASARQARVPDERTMQSARRIRREIARTISGSRTENEITRIFFSGEELPGLLATDFEVPTEPLHLPALEGVAEGTELAAAYGAALRRLGAGTLQPRLRREELRYAGKFERIELPLAVFFLLLATFLGVKLIITRNQIMWRDEGDLAAGIPGDLQIWMQASNAYMLPNPEDGWKGNLNRPPEDLDEYARLAERGGDTNRTKYEELLQIKRRLSNYVRDLQKDLGQVSEVSQPLSALEGATYVLNVLDDMGPRLGRFAIRNLEAVYVHSRNSRNKEHISVTLDMDFFGDEVGATRQYNALENALQDEPWCLEVEDRGSENFDNGIFVNGLRIQVDPTAMEGSQ